MTAEELVNGAEDKSIKVSSNMQANAASNLKEKLISNDCLLFVSSLCSNSCYKKKSGWTSFKIWQAQVISLKCKPKDYFCRDLILSKECKLCMQVFSPQSIYQSSAQESFQCSSTST